ncbi:MAG: transglycosylase SLT domain-containing protein [Opitutaceae bacterium]|nr:transglycosylase SLT domain-containing protein [Cytophagales bacterium]
MRNWKYILISFLVSFQASETYAQYGLGPLLNLEPEDSLYISTDSIALANFDYVPDFTATEVRNRLNSISGDIQLTFNTHVFSFIDYLTVRNREYARMILQRQSLYIPTFEKYLALNKMPDELKYLTIVESGLNPKALSRSGALGLWQFIPSTGKWMGLRIDSHFDERMNVEKSTEAACKYLKSLYNSFGDWQLALAAYNCGPGVVGRVVKKYGKKDFWKLYNYLPAETRSYVPQFIAVTYLMNFHKEHNLYPEYYEYPMAYDTVSVSQYVNIDILCKHMGICSEDIFSLNPEIKRNYIPNSESKYVLRYPIDKSDFFRQNRHWLLDSISESVSEIVELNKRLTTPVINTVIGKRTYHKVSRGQTLNMVAATYRVSVSQIKSWNHLKGHKLKAGQRLVIWKQTPKIKAHETTRYPVPKKKFYEVRQGDTLWSISKKFNNVTVAQLKKLNNLGDGGLKIGQKLIIQN